MNDTQLTASVIALTTILRRARGLDGPIVPLLAVVVGAILCVLASPGAWREGLVRGITVGLTAVGGMSALGYVGTKVGEGLANAPLPLPPDSEPIAGTKEST